MATLPIEKIVIAAMAFVGIAAAYFGTRLIDAAVAFLGIEKPADFAVVRVLLAPQDPGLPVGLPRELPLRSFE